MKSYSVDVTYKGIITQRIIVSANTKEEAKEKIKLGTYDDIIDTFSETEEIIDFDFFAEQYEE